MCLKITRIPKNRITYLIHIAIAFSDMEEAGWQLILVSDATLIKTTGEISTISMTCRKVYVQIFDLQVTHAAQVLNPCLRKLKYNPWIAMLRGRQMAM